MNTSPISQEAINYHDHLNPAIWQADGQMDPTVREHLLEMASAFRDFLGVENLDIRDIIVCGSNAAYSYTPHSDVDVHIVAKVPDDLTPLYLELFDAKKNLFNSLHDYKVKGFDVEMYVQDSRVKVESLGIYSLLRDTWIDFPKQMPAQVDDIAVLSKVQYMEGLITNAIRSNDKPTMEKAWKNVRDMRSAGLDRGGEFSPENLSFKVLRSRGLIKELYDSIIQAGDSELSLEHIEEDMFSE